MKKIYILLLLVVLTSPLIGCINQDQADEKIARGCEAAINSVITPKTVLSIKSKNFSDEIIKDEGKHRRISLTLVEKDGWVELDKTYSCLFLEQWGIFKSSHKALLIQVDIDGEITGKVEGHIMGGFDEFLTLNKAVDEAMKQ